MRSIAIWYSSEPGQLKIDSVELHFNLLKAPTMDNTYHRFLDIGIMVSKTTCIKELKIYLPVKINSDSVRDIVKDFINDNTIVCAIFNENYKTIVNPNSKTHQIYNQSNLFQFDVYSLDTSDIMVTDEYDGSTIKITPPQTNNKTYFRIRINQQYCESI